MVPTDRIVSPVGSATILDKEDRTSRAFGHVIFSRRSSRGGKELLEKWLSIIQEPERGAYRRTRTVNEVIRLGTLRQRRRLAGGAAVRANRDGGALGNKRVKFGAGID